MLRDRGLIQSIDADGDCLANALLTATGNLHVYTVSRFQQIIMDKFNDLPTNIKVCISEQVQMDLVCARDDAKAALLGKCTKKDEQGHEYVLTHVADYVLDLPRETMIEEHNTEIVQRTKRYLHYCHKMHIADSVEVLDPIWYDGFVMLVLAPLVLQVRGVTTLTMKRTVSNNVSSTTTHFVSTNEWEASLKLQQAYDLSSTHQVVMLKDESTYNSTHYELVNAGAVEDIKMPPFLWTLKDKLTHQIAKKVCCTVMEQDRVQAAMVQHRNKSSSQRLAARPSTTGSHLATNLNTKQLPRPDPKHMTAPTPSRLDTQPKASIKRRSQRKTASIKSYEEKPAQKSQRKMVNAKAPRGSQRNMEKPAQKEGEASVAWRSQRKKVSASWSTRHESQRNIDDASVVKLRRSTRARVQVVVHALVQTKPKIYGGFMDNFGAFPT